MEMPLFVLVPDPSPSQPQVCCLLEPMMYYLNPCSPFFMLIIYHFLPFIHERFALIAWLFVDYPEVVCQILLFINL